MHFHGYAYVGPGEAIGSFDRANRAPDGVAFSGSKHPPFFVSHWLYRPAAAVLATFDEPEDAVDWLAQRFEDAHTGDRRPWPDMATRRPDSVSQLASGNNVMYAAWVNTSTLAEYYMVACPPPGGEAPCPTRRSDKRPEGATVMTGMP